VKIMDVTARRLAWIGTDNDNLEHAASRIFAA
jgi:hypothetical protein